MIAPTPAQNLDRVVRSEPIDRTARLVTGNGWHYKHEVEDIPMNARHSPEALPTRPPNGPGQAALIGVKFGRFQVMGVHVGRKNPQRGARYVVRCLCGNYEIRYRKAITNKANVDDCCRVCDHVRRMREVPE